jgi:nucleotide sugar dehydrogenase
MGMIAIHGLGYAGLTAAVHFAKEGCDVVGYDVDQNVVDAINAGKPRANDFLSYLATDVAALVQQGRLRATTNFEDVATREVHLLDVPTEKDGMPYMTLIKDVIAKLALSVPTDALIIVESTVAPGTTDELLKEDADFYARMVEDGSLDYAICPRRDWFADPTKNLSTLPRVVGGFGVRSTGHAREILSIVAKSHLLLESDYRTAEVTKALENALLQVPVMFAYELAAELPDVNVAEALRLACTHWRFVSLGGLHLGFGTGGRCVPLGTQYLAEAVRKRGQWLGLGEAAIRANKVFPARISKIVRAAMRTSDDRSLVLGIGYRPEFKDAGSSPGLAVARALAKHHVLVTIHDHLFSDEELCRMVEEGENVTVLRDRALEDKIGDFDFVLLATPHGRYATLPAQGRWRPGQVVLDGSGAWAGQRARFRDLGVRYVRVGEPGWTALKAV